MYQVQKIINKKRMGITRGLGIVMISAGLLAACALNADAVSETGREDHLIADGVTESTVYVTDGDEKNVRVHILRIASDADVSFKVTCKGYYTEGSTSESRAAKAAEWGADDWGYQTLGGLADAYESAGDTKGEVIAASNGDFFDKETAAPFGKLVIEGHVINSSQAEPFFAVLKDGSCVIRDSNGETGDVEEAVAGAWWLVRDGKNLMDHRYPQSEPRQVIGICEDDTVVIINADGREPASLGLNIYDLAELARQQGCVDAINLDGGGSASFLTKRPEDDGLVFRNVPGDGFERQVTGSLLIVRNRPGEESSADGEVSAVSMKEEGTSLTEKDGIFSYSIAGDLTGGFQTVNGHTYLFGEDGKGLTETVRIGGSSYGFTGGLLTDCSDKDAGAVVIGYCGASDGGRNLLYAYQKGNDILNIGLNPFAGSEDGAMLDWTHETLSTMPWYSLRSDVRKVTVGEGVTTVGDRFLFVYKGEVFDGTMTPESKLESLTLPESLESIGEMAFYNKPNLKNLVLPSKIRKIGKNAFAGAGTGYVRFTGNKPPETGKSAIDVTNFDVLCVPDTEEWSEYLDSDASPIGIESTDVILCSGSVPFLGKMIDFK